MTQKTTTHKILALKLKLHFIILNAHRVTKAKNEAIGLDEDKRHVFSVPKQSGNHACVAQIGTVPVKVWHALKDKT